MNSKTEIIFLIILAVIGIVEGATFSFISSDYSYTVLNHTDSSANTNDTPSNEASSDTTDNQFISESRAISIAKAAMPGSPQYFVTGYPSSDSPYYVVAGHDPNYYGPDAYIRIDARTGEVVEKVI